MLKNENNRGAKSTDDGVWSNTHVVFRYICSIFMAIHGLPSACNVHLGFGRPSGMPVPICDVDIWDTPDGCPSEM